jgi:hypothetical protein
MKFENYANNIGNELIKKIYGVAYGLYATRIVVHKAKYNKFAVVDLFENNDAICHDYIVSL